MARMKIVDTNGNAYTTTSSEASQHEVKNFADFVAQIQSGDIKATTAIEIDTNRGTVYLMPAVVASIEMV